MSLSPLGSSYGRLLHCSAVAWRGVLGLTLFHHYKLVVEAQCYFYPWLYIVEQSWEMWPMPLWRTLARLISACPTVQCNQISSNVNVGQMGAITAMERDLSAYRLALSLHPFLFLFSSNNEERGKTFHFDFFVYFFNFPSFLSTLWQKAYLILTSLSLWSVLLVTHNGTLQHLKI